MNRVAGRLVLSLGVVAPLAIGAQAAPPPPTLNVLTIYRETVKIGKRVEHDAHEEAWARANMAVNHPVPMLAMTAMSGAPESWYMSAYPSWAEYEKSSKLVDGTAALSAIDKQFSSKEDEYLSDGRTLVLTRRDDLSYGPPAKLSEMRFMSVTRIATRPGHSAEYEENRKMVKAAHESAKLADSYSMWQVAGGAPAGTYFLMVARKSLAELDSGNVIHNDAYRAALGGEDARKKMTANQAAAIVNSETNTFAFVPAQSMPPAQWIAADPGYWKPKVAAKRGQ